MDDEVPWQQSVTTTFPLSGVERMVAGYERHEEEEKKYGRRFSKTEFWKSHPDTIDPCGLKRKVSAATGET